MRQGREGGSSYHVKEILAAAGLEVEAGEGEDDAAQVGDRELLGVVQGVLGDTGDKKKTKLERAGTGKRLKTPPGIHPAPRQGRKTQARDPSGLI